MQLVSMNIAAMFTRVCVACTPMARLWAISFYLTEAAEVVEQWSSSEKRTHTRTRLIFVDGIHRKATRFS